MNEIDGDVINNDELSEWLPDSRLPVEAEDEAKSDAAKQTKGRQRVPEQWSRVINIWKLDVNQVRVFPITTDLLLAQGLPTMPTKRRHADWSPYFYPKEWVKEHRNVELSDF